MLQHDYRGTAWQNKFEVPKSDMAWLSYGAGARPGLAMAPEGGHRTVLGREGTVAFALGRESSELRTYQVFTSRVYILFGTITLSRTMERTPQNPNIILRISFGPAFWGLFATPALQARVAILCLEGAKRANGATGEGNMAAQKSVPENGILVNGAQDSTLRFLVNFDPCSHALNAQTLPSVQILFNGVMEGLNKLSGLASL